MLCVILVVMGFDARQHGSARRDVVRIKAYGFNIIANPLREGAGFMQKKPADAIKLLRICI